MDSLDNIRKTIDEIDLEMLKLFEKRMNCAEKVIDYKVKNDLPVLDVKREKELIIERTDLLQNKEYEDYYKEFINYVMDISKKYQYRLAHKDFTGYQGVEGAFSYIAAKKLFPVSNLVSFNSFEDVFIALDKGDIAFGVLPFENSYTGEIGEVFDLLMKYDCYITQMSTVPIKQNLVGVKGAEIKDIKEVYSHQQAISQSQTFLNSLDVKTLPYANTAIAAKYVSKKNDKSLAAIASRETAELYNLSILAENINTSADNTTKFVVITKTPNKKGSKISLMLTVKHDAGRLSKVIEIIAKYNCNMENIRSRPLKGSMWQYYFYIEISASFTDENTSKMIEEIEENCTGLKILGNYNLI